MHQKHLISPETRINSKWIKDLDVRPETIKYLEENIGGTLSHLNLKDIFDDTNPVARKTKAETNQWDYIKLKSFCTSRETIKQTNRPLTEWEKIFTCHTPDKKLITKIYKELSILSTRKANDPIKNGQRI